MKVTINVTVNEDGQIAVRETPQDDPCTEMFCVTLSRKQSRVTAEAVLKAQRSDQRDAAGEPGP